MADEENLEPEVPETAHTGPTNEEKVVASPSLNGDKKADVSRWQEKNLPFMRWMIIALAIAFFVFTVIQFVSLQVYIARAPEITELIPTIPTPAPMKEGTKVNEEYEELKLAAERTEQEFWSNKLRVLATLEAHLIERRYYQANISMMSRVWIRYVGFITGMILAFVGATFILGKLSEESTTVQGENPVSSISLTSSSPGLVLATLGVFLMITSLAIRHNVDISDRPRYVSDIYSISEPADPVPTPQPSVDVRVAPSPTLQAIDGE